MHFAREPFSLDLVRDLAPLLTEHANEVAHYADIPLDVDWGLYASAHTLGTLRAFTARTDAGQLIGYGIFFVRPNPHYQGSRQAVQDVLFIQAQHRGRGGRFIAWCDAQLQADGVQVVYQHVKQVPHLNFGPLLERLGYEPIDMIYGRRLDGRDGGDHRGRGELRRYGGTEPGPTGREGRGAEVCGATAGPSHD